MRIKSGIAEVIERSGCAARRFEQMDGMLAADAEARRMAKEVNRLAVTAGRGLLKPEKGKDGDMGVLYTIVGIGLVLGVMVLIHEWGHFIVARIVACASTSFPSV